MYFTRRICIKNIPNGHRYSCAPNSCRRNITNALASASNIAWFYPSGTHCFHFLLHTVLILILLYPLFGFCCGHSKFWLLRSSSFNLFFAFGVCLGFIEYGFRASSRSWKKRFETKLIEYRLNYRFSSWIQSSWCVINRFSAPKAE